MAEAPNTPPTHPDPESNALYARLQALQAKSPETVGAILDTIWSGLTPDRQETLRQEAIAVSPDDEAEQAAYLQRRLITTYINAPDADTSERWRQNGTKSPETRRDF